MTKFVLTQEFLKSMLDYNPVTGVFVWKERTPDMFNDGGHTKEHNCAAWNAKFTGKIAGCFRTDGYLTIRLLRRNYQAHQLADRKSTRLNSSHTDISRMPSSA